MAPTECSPSPDEPKLFSTTCGCHEGEPQRRATRESRKGAGVSVRAGQTPGQGPSTVRSADLRSLSPGSSPRTHLEKGHLALTLEALAASSAPLPGIHSRPPRQTRARNGKLQMPVKQDQLRPVLVPREPGEGSVAPGRTPVVQEHQQGARQAGCCYSGPTVTFVGPPSCSTSGHR